MAHTASKRRGNAEEWPWRGDSSVTLAAPSHALRSSEPRLGRGFIEGSPKGRQDEEGLTVASYLLGKLGSRGYGRMLQRANSATHGQARTRPARRSRRRRTRKAVAA